MEEYRTHPSECKDMQISTSVELLPTLLSHAIYQCDLSYLYAIKFSSCCLQYLLCLTPTYWSSLLSSAHISPYNRYALLKKHHMLHFPSSSSKAIIIYLELCLFSKCFNYNSLFLFFSLCSCHHALTKLWLNNPKNISWGVSHILKQKITYRSNRDMQFRLTLLFTYYLFVHI